MVPGQFQAGDQVGGVQITCPVEDGYQQIGIISQDVMISCVCVFLHMVGMLLAEVQCAALPQLRGF